ncbi:MAG: M3 family oligoendopeptidase [Erysipelotrichia bacterium]|nr:M3 family oligoendopeptidase [Erysipelotrichia bacterium]
MKFEEYPLRVLSLKRVEKKLGEAILNLQNSKTPKDALATIRKLSRYADDLSTDMTIISIRYSLDTENKIYQKAQNKTDEISPLIANYFNQWSKVLVASPFRKELEEKLGKYYFEMIESSLKSFDEKIVPELIQENKLDSEYSKILGSAQIDFKGEVLNLSQIGKYAIDKDRKTRHDATAAIDKWFGENEAEIARIYDELVHLRDQMAKKLGFKNFVELGYLRLGRLDYDAKMVENYRKQIAETAVPLSQKLYKRQAKRLGMKMSDMATYDFNLSFLSGNPKPVGESKDLIATATKMYDDMSKETGEFFHFMLDNHLLDLEARKGKAPGGYMTYMPRYKAPFIFSNFNGTEGDVNVLTHEVGHAFQGYLSKDIKIPEYRSPTYEACEIHSMSMEFFAWPYMDGFFGKDADKYLFSHLEGAVQFLPYGITIDEFQHWVYENPNATHVERCAKFSEIEKRYTPHKRYVDSPTFEKGGTWMRQSHVFGSPFYYIDYTLAQVVAMQFFVEMRKNKEKAWKKYVKLCKFGGKEPFVGLLQKNKLRNPFEDGNVKKVLDPVAKVLASFDDSKM